MHHDEAMNKEDPQRKVYNIIADDMGVPTDKVARLYALVLSRYVKQAKVKDFLNVIVERRVRILLAKIKAQQKIY